MNTAQIAELLNPFLRENQNPSDTLLENISIYINILTHWNERLNLTAIRDPEQIVKRHFGESLFAARYLFPNHVGTDPLVRPAEQSSAATQVTLADVGSGAGFPGIPIKLWAPQISLTLIESNHKKATFLHETARALTLTDINIQTARAETLPPASFDVVTLRAVERFDQVLPTAAALAKPTGRLALLLGSAQVPQAQSILPHHRFKHPIPIPLSRSRVVLISIPSTPPA